MEDIDVKVILTIPRKKVEEDKKEIEHWNPGSMQNDEDIKQHYLEYFWGDKHEYLCSADIEVIIAEDQSNE